MAIYETGHAKNVANFALLVQEVTTLGPMYKPGTEDIKLPALNAKNGIVQAKMSAYDAALAAWKSEVNGRQTEYEKMNTLSARVMGQLKSLDLNAKIVKDANGIVKKIRGQRARRLPPTPEPISEERAETISSSQRSFDNRKDNFEKLIKLVGTVQDYKPNEAELTIAGLGAYLASLGKVNDKVNRTGAELAKARKERDIELYREKTGAVDIALRVKEYVKGALTPSNPAYKRIKAIRFKDLLLSAAESK
ncbi:MAG: hypothetical protein AB1393_05560 [Candidatus Edwardsbacteria bacterium]